MEEAAKAIAKEAGAIWPQDAGRYRRYAQAALATQADALAKVTAALDDTQATLSAIRASLTGDAATCDLQHIFNLAGEQMVRNRAALTDTTP